MSNESWDKEDKTGIYGSKATLVHTPTMASGYVSISWCSRDGKPEALEGEGTTSALKKPYA